METTLISVDRLKNLVRFAASGFLLHADVRQKREERKKSPASGANHEECISAISSLLERLDAISTYKEIGDEVVEISALLSRYTEKEPRSVSFAKILYIISSKHKKGEVKNITDDDIQTLVR